VAKPYVAWCDLEGLPAVPGVEVGTQVDLLEDTGFLQRVTFYVPSYLAGERALRVMPEMARLEVVQLPSAGYDGVLPFVPEGVTLCNARGLHDTATAELAVGLAIAGRRGFADFGAAHQRHEWNDGVWPGLADSAVAIVGFGSIGRHVGRLLEPFQVSVTGFSRSGSEGAEPVTTLADRIGDFDAAMLGRMREGALLVNVGRGPVVVTDALVAELEAGRLHAALDVTDPEPLPVDHPLWDAPHCFLSPHVGGNTHAFGPRARRLVADQLGRYVSGAPLANIVRPGAR
jgi:phosphoglycerate dehydrogenase-like enzyme